MDAGLSGKEVLVARFRWSAHLSSTWQSIRGSYWFLPSCMATVAGAGALFLLDFDRSVDLPAALELPWIYTTSPEGSRSVLSVVAGSMINVTGVVFSITIVALTLASSQFGPRLLRNFMRDRSNQLVMGTLLSSFLFSLLALAAVDSSRTHEFVPYLTTVAAVGLGIASLFVLIFFIHRAASSIQATNIIQSVANEIDTCLPRIFPESIGSEPANPDAAVGELEHRLANGLTVSAPCSGYVRVIDAEGLLEIARDCDVVIGIACRPGDFAARGAPLAVIDGTIDETVVADIQGTFALGPQRTAVQDLEFLTGQLTEMAVRALSPGVNDPSTAIACIHRLGAVLAQLAAREFPSPYRLDETGTLRVVARVSRFEEMLIGMLAPIRRYGAGDAEVCLALLAAIGQALSVALSERAPALRTLAEEVVAAGLAEATAHSDRERLLAAGKRLAGSDEAWQKGWA